MEHLNTYDARKGLQPEALDELRRAGRVTLAVKDDMVAALGYWVLPPEAQEVKQAGVILLDLEKTRLFPQRSARPLSCGQVHVLLDIQKARDNERWTRALDLLRPGDIVRVTYFLDRRSAASSPRPSTRRARLNVFHGRDLLATVELLSS